MKVFLNKTVNVHNKLIFKRIYKVINIYSLASLVYIE